VLGVIFHKFSTEFFARISRRFISGLSTLLTLKNEKIDFLKP
jgi:hypothetical protein